MAAALVDLVCVLVFVAIGRAGHDEDGLGGFATTAWPFLAGLAIGWAVTRAWRRPAALVPGGLGIWLCTLVAGMLLRALSGQGTAFAFILVATAFLAMELLGRRLVVTAARRPGRP